MFNNMLHFALGGEKIFERNIFLMLRRERDLEPALREIAWLEWWYLLLSLSSVRYLARKT